MRADHSHKMPAGLVLGSVQLGVAYGAANRLGKPSHEAALSLVRRAHASGINEFDTARAYGDSEARLGEALAGRKEVRTITKLSPLADLSADASREAVRAAVNASIEASLAALQHAKLDCLLLHRASHRTAYNGAVWDRLIELLEEGTVLSLGVSVQSPQEALEALDCADISHIQLPFNLLDWRWREAGVLERARARSSVTIHARSVFLQGVLAAEDALVWPAISGLDLPHVLGWLSATARKFHRTSIADLCLAYARGQDWIDGVVIGMETEAQLEDNLLLSTRPPLAREDCACIEASAPRVPEQLLDPARWPKTT